jgi:formylglycine-generating enzyme required for sulfatase activity
MSITPITPVLSKKNALGGMAALFMALVLAGCWGNGNPTGGGEGNVSELSKGRSPVTLANLEETMVLVEGGSFKMGCRSDFEEKPSWVNADGNDTGGTTWANSTCWPLTQQDSVVNTFYICRFEVTQGLWKEVMRTSETPSIYKGDDLPVTNITGYQIWAFIDSLNKKSEKFTYRLPSEKEWEYAASGGTESLKYQYSGGSAASAVAWYGDTEVRRGPHPVGSKSPNELGIHDMSGNVWELAIYNPSGDLGRGGDYFERGGNWYGFESYCSITYRSRLAGNRSAEGIQDRGFRIAATLKQ